MSELAQIHLRQGRQFIKTGNPAKAIELLQKAAALSERDSQLHQQVLLELIAACEFAGQTGDANHYRQQLPTPNPQPDIDPSEPPEPQPHPKPHLRWPSRFGRYASNPSISTLLFTHLAVGALSGLAVWLWLTHNASVTPDQSAAPTATTLPTIPNTAVNNLQTPEEIAEHYESILKEFKSIREPEK